MYVYVYCVHTPQYMRDCGRDSRHVLFKPSRVRNCVYGCLTIYCPLFSVLQAAIRTLHFLSKEKSYFFPRGLLDFSNLHHCVSLISPPQEYYLRLPCYRGFLLSRHLCVTATWPVRFSLIQ